MSLPPLTPPPPPGESDPGAAAPAPPAPAPDAGFRLLVLDCPGCGAPVGADGEDVVYYCTACRSGYRLSAEKGPGREALAPVEVAFVALAGKVAQRYLPFWLLPARATLHQRQAAGGGFRGLLGFFLGEGGEGQGPGEGTFVIPAFDSPLAHATALARRYTEAFPQLGERLGEKLTGGCYGVEDAEKLAHFTLIASEAEKPDTLQDLHYEIVFGVPRLLGVPFVEQGGRLYDALFNLPA